MYRFPDELIQLIDYESVRGMMNYQMILNRGPVPDELQAFGQMLNNLNLENTEGVFRGIVVGSDASVALVFATNPMIRAFQEGTTFAMDNTFEVRFLIYFKKY